MLFFVFNVDYHIVDIFDSDHHECKFDDWFNYYFSDHPEYFIVKLERSEVEDFVLGTLKTFPILQDPRYLS